MGLIQTINFTFPKDSKEKQLIEARLRRVTVRIRMTHRKLCPHPVDQKSKQRNLRPCAVLMAVGGWRRFVEMYLLAYDGRIGRHHRQNIQYEYGTHAIALRLTWRFAMASTLLFDIFLVDDRSQQKSERTGTVSSSVFCLPRYVR